jgi:hypothetical protein
LSLFWGKRCSRVTESLGAGVQGCQTLLVEGLDRIAHRPIIAADTVGKRRSALAAPVGEQHLTAAHYRRLARA